MNKSLVRHKGGLIIDKQKTKLRLNASPVEYEFMKSQNKRKRNPLLQVLTKITPVLAT